MGDEERGGIREGSRGGGACEVRGGGYEFRYAREYLRDAGAPSVAFSLSKREAVHRSKVLFPFFFGLLAEGPQKALQCRYLKIDERDHFTRLVETCREGVIGAVYVKPRGRMKRAEVDE